METQRGLRIINFDTRGNWRRARRQHIRDSCRRRTAGTWCRANTSQHVHGDWYHGTLFCLLPLLQERRATRVPSPWNRALHGLACFLTENPWRIATVQNTWKWGRLPIFLFRKNWFCQGVLKAICSAFLGWYVSGCFCGCREGNWQYGSCIFSKWLESWGICRWPISMIVRRHPIKLIVHG